MMRVIAFGEALIDMLALPGEGQRRFLEQPGGAPANVAVGVAKLGGQASFVGQVGNDMFGDKLARAMRGYGVDTSPLLQTDDALTALAFVSLDDKGERSFAFYRHGSADLLYRVEHCPPGIFSRPAIFHSGSNTLTEPDIHFTTLALMQKARQAGCLVSFDVNYRHNLWTAGANAREPIWDAMVAADIVKLSREELDALYGNEDKLVRELLEAGVRLILVTDGGNPLNVHWSGGSTQLTPTKAQVNDSTAAGDAFVAGLLYQLADQDIVPATLDRWIEDEARLGKALTFANKCGAVAVSRYGAFDALPNREEVR
ncbi:carbohydrate kinase family protein [Marinobacter fonticola]|uniref:carbohydrate kinase family protein n=1 Tax=Marinobacter fonticola TaxID=2603215 RepID=UPI0011E81007|nr:carbohydrate kinase [Marinobacter fonticola]